MLSRVFLFLILSFFLVPLSNNIQAEESFIPDDVIDALDSAGTNRGELEKVISHYQPSKDTLKITSCPFSDR